MPCVGVKGLIGFLACGSLRGPRADLVDWDDMSPTASPARARDENSIRVAVLFTCCSRGAPRRACQASLAGAAGLPSKRWPSSQ